jgi:hypothetical protein
MVIANREVRKLVESVVPEHVDATQNPMIGASPSAAHLHSAATQCCYDDYSDGLLQQVVATVSASLYRLSAICNRMFMRL